MLPIVAAVGDPDGTRTITSIIALLVALGLALVMIAIWHHRTTRPDPELLAPLDVMGDRKWRRADPVWQRRRLDEVRPEGAQPLEPAVAPPDLDEAFDRGPQATGFDDLHDSAEVPVVLPRRQPVAPASLAPPAPDAQSVEAPTPEGLKRPTLDDLPDHDLDPALVAQAMAVLEAELGATRPGDAAPVE